MNREIFKAFFTRLLGIFSALLTNLWLLRNLVLWVNDEDFALYAVFLQTSVYLSILQLGLDMSVTRQVAENLGAKRVDEAVRAAIQLRWFNRRGAIVCLGITVIATIAVWQIWPNHSQRLLATILVALTGITQVVGYLSRSATAILSGSGRLASVNIITVLRSLASTLVAYCLLRGGVGVVSMPIAELGVQIAGMLAMIWLVETTCRWSYKDVAFPMSGFARTIRFGLMTVAGGIAWTLEATSDVFLLLAFSPSEGKEAVALYVLWWRFPQMAFNLCAALPESAFPGFAHAATDAIRSRYLFRRVAALSIGLAISCVVGIGVWLAPLVDHWLNGKYSPAGASQIAILMALLVGLRAIGNIFAVYWLSLGDARLTTLLSWMQAVVKICLSVPLIERSGIRGLLVASIASASFQVVAIALRLWQRKVIDFLFLVEGLICLGVSLVLATLGARQTAGASLTETILGIAITGAILGSSVFLYWRRSKRVEYQFQHSGDLRMGGGLE